MNKKKLLAIGLVACMACGALAGCGGNDKTPTNNNGKVDKQVEDKVDKNINKEKSTESKDVYAGLDITDANKHLGDVVNYARTSTDVDTYKPVLSKDQKGADTVFEVLGVTNEDMEEFAISVDETAENAYAVAVVKPAKDKEETVRAGFEAFIEAKKQATDEKDTAETDIISAATVEKVGDYLVLVMCKDNSDVMTKLTEGINNPTIIENYLNEMGAQTEDSFRKEDTKNTTEDGSTTNIDTNADADLNNEIVPAEGTEQTEQTDANVTPEASTEEPTINVDSANGATTSDTWQ